MWQDLLPDSLILEIFSYLDTPDLGVVAQVCKSWKRVSQDELLWHRLAVSKYQIPAKDCLAAGKSSWREEIIRLTYHVPNVCTEVFQVHSDEVLDVSFSHDGNYFCTTSKDAQAILWKTGYPTRQVDKADMAKDYKWTLCQYSAFNSDDSLLLVCGVCYEEDDNFDRTGYGGIFTVKEGALQIIGIVSLEPPTLFGAWLNDRCVLGGLPVQDIDHIMAYKVSDDHKALENVPNLDIQGLRLFRLMGNRFHLMNLLVAHIPVNLHETSPAHEMDWSSVDGTDGKQNIDSCLISDKTGSAQIDGRSVVMENVVDQHWRRTRGADMSASESALDENDRSVVESVRHKEQRCSDVNSGEKSKHSCDQNIKHYVIFVNGHHDTIVVHELTDDHMRNVEEGVDGSEDVKQPEFVFLYEDSYITGATLSADNRYVYVNYREMDKKHAANQPIDGEVISVRDKVFSEAIKIGFIDLYHMCQVQDVVYKGHVGFSSFPAWYICLDSSEDYVGRDISINMSMVSSQYYIEPGQSGIYRLYMFWTGDKTFQMSPTALKGLYWLWFIFSCSEDSSVYIWDRHYQVLLSKLEHDKLYDLEEGEINLVTNGIAFSPVDQETCVTVCDDRLIKVWRSKHRLKNLISRINS